MPARFTDAFKNAVANSGFNAALGTSATFRLKAGPPAATVGTPASGTTLVTFTLASTPFQAASNGGEVVHTPIGNVNASATGTVGCAELLDSSSNIVADFDENDASLDTVPNSIVAGSPVALASLKLKLST